ncbi:MAG: dienelactone hydrolase family protein [Planctomycetes bacterium]|nr:dienelactone hydrolase family protein [Planctomycetota bacterium]
MDHPWMQQVAAGLAARGLRVARFEFPYMHGRRTGVRRGPDRMPVLQDCLRAAVAAATAGGRSRLALAGKSMGGRVATMLADELGAAAVVVFGYPFHPPRRPNELRTAHLATLATPTLILQGDRDPFGVPDEVDSYDLSPAITVEWLPDGDHSLAPRKRSGHSAEGHLAHAIAAAAAFVGEPPR